MRIARRSASSVLAAVGLGAIAIVAACGDDGVGPIEPPYVHGDGGDATPDGVVTSPYGLDVRPPNGSCVAPERPAPAGPVKFQQVFADTPMYPSTMLGQIPGDKSRVFLSAIHGVMVAFSKDSPPTDAPPFVLTIPVPINQMGEGGFFGFAFHPKFATNGYVYLSFTTNSATSPVDMRSVVARMKSTDNGSSFGDYTEVLTFDQPAPNHNGGGIAFGPDGYLYLSFGDGGGGDDTFKNGQTLNGFFSKVLRIDVDSPPAPGRAYAIPKGNPFENGGGEAAVWAYGLRNPFRMTIDRPTGDVWIGDVGQGAWEEVDRITAPGGNHGWPCREGTHDYLLAPDVCPNGTTGLVNPVFEYAQGASGAAITGGAVYRGSAIPSFVGTYVYGDFVTQQIWALDFDPTTGAPRSTQLNTTGPFGSWGGFSLDDDGELYAIDLGAKIYKMVPAGPTAPSTFPDRLSKTGCFDPSDARKPLTALLPYSVNAELWSDGAEKQRWLAVPDGKTITTLEGGDLDLPAGSLLFKTFSLAGKPVETRMLVRHADGGWAGYSYEWNDAGTDAALLPSGKTTSAWSFPGRGECMTCHTKAANFTLGLELGQLSRDQVYPSTSKKASQLATLEHIGVIEKQPVAPAALAEPFGTAPIDARARAYLHANCSFCHRPTGGGGGTIDLRSTASLATTKACDAPIAGTLGLADAKVIAPGAPAKSVLLSRMRSTTRMRMPPLATRKIDTGASALIEQWIGGLGTCPP